MKAYKATRKNMKCLGFQYELNQEFFYDGELTPCISGFHFCKNLIDVFYYYEFTSINRFFEVEIPDDALVIDIDNKSVTNKIKFIRELSSADIKELTNGKCYVDEDGGWKTPLFKLFVNAEGQFHRKDGPAVIHANGYQAWYQNGKHHREDGPARIFADGRQEWWKNGKLHRVDGPAVIDADGYQAWYQNGILQREEYYKQKLWHKIIEKYNRLTHNIKILINFKNIKENK